jgi:hypothetical protein
VTPLLFGVVLALVGSAIRAAPAEAATARELHSAQCVAALEVSTESLAQQVRAGHDEARAELQTRLEAGTAFVGDAYLHGTTDERHARALANDALESQKRLSAAELAALQEACAAEGARMLATSNGLERSVVKHLAKKRMDKLLGG